jgi:hypothetical protein
MAADGSRGPKPWTQRRASTTFLRVPHVDWPKVKNGLKREFRAGTGSAAVSQLWSLPTPTVVVGYSIDDQQRYDHRLLVLENHWREPLGAITPESLRAEGCKDLAEFRRYWMNRERRRFRPTREVSVYRVRPAQTADLQDVGDRLVQHLYGDFLTGAPARIPSDSLGP